MACSVFPGSVNCTRKYELYEKKIWIVREKNFSGTIHIFFSYSSYFLVQLTDPGNSLHAIFYRSLIFSTRFTMLGRIKQNLLYAIIEIKLQKFSLNWITYPLTTLLCEQKFVWIEYATVDIIQGKKFSSIKTI